MRLTKYISTVLFLIFFSSCAKKVYRVNQSEYTQNTFINESLPEDSTINQMIRPYKEKLDGEMNRVISYTPIDLPKNGFNSPLANLNCDMIWEEANLIYEQLHGQKIDMCLLNSGGIRRTFTKGDLTVRNVYELMPFENEALVVTLSGEKVLEMVQYLSDSELGHPISGIKFIPRDTLSIEINGQKFDKNKTYTVVTNDYLQKGGDQMNFLSNPLKMEMLNTRLRDLMMQYFEKHDTVKVNLDKRILK